MEEQAGFDYSLYEDNGSANWSFSPPGFPTNELQCKEHHKTDVLFAGFAVCIIVVGLIGNLLVFSTIVVLREYRHSMTNWYILQLTIADTLFLAMLPLTAHSELVGMWDFSLALCKFKEAVLFINYYASIYFLVIMSFDRYLAVTEALHSNSWMTFLRKPAAAYAISAIGWVMSVLLCIQLYKYSTITHCKVCAYNFPLDEPPTQKLTNLSILYEDDDYFGDYSEFTDEEIHNLYQLVFEHVQSQQSQRPTIAPAHKLCKLPESYTLKVWVYGNFIGAFCIPFVLICFFYGVIMKTISSARTNGFNITQRSYKRRVTMIVLALVTLFAISWLPWYVDKILRINGIHLSESGCKTLKSSVRGLAYLNSALNPYFYSFLGTHFRDRLHRVYSRIGLGKSFKTKLRGSSGTRNRRRRTSHGNTGVTKCLNKQRNRQLNCQNPYGNYLRDSRRSSLSIRTERTIV